ncbi:uncharacterized protein J7T54_001060 [Emericellopsis cladophorae]|uniref:UDENN FLCN/SMCR8-type domain-containing protein n=1 Tax=Emericellopsis cladophorae TaxID=2686198 RepID=A0A9Q0BCF0_9HYPO|nr:uncharacterized protein J7T54_001060 [Emericellopsis cladophorae]KAI6780752.1 hypothetical protein J7T54_001060 [Emericellopsis cladophorae]
MARDLELIPRTFQLAIAHYCDSHGPTPLMVTEAIPTNCNTCYDYSSSPDSQQGSPTPGMRDVNDRLRHMTIRSSTIPTSEPRTSTNGQRQSSILKTPPGSPHGPPQPRRDSSFRRTYDDTVTKKQGPCENCAMTIPRQSASNGPEILRTRVPAARVFGPAGQASPPISQTSSDTEGEAEATGSRRPQHSRRGPPPPPVPSSRSSISSESAPSHTHYVDYTSTHEPTVATSFSLLRACCLRALSFETLPRAPNTSSAAASYANPSSIPPSPSSATASFVTTHSNGAAVSGGSIFFGDALAGYTTAYIFRIPDVHARGHKRIYAFLALSTYRETKAVKTFAKVSSAFHELAIWIQKLAEAEAERAAEASPTGSNAHTSSGGFSQPSPVSAMDSMGPRSSGLSGGSSFLTGGSGFTRRTGGGGGASAPKARGLPDLVGQPDFFVALHAKFVNIFFEIGVSLSG